MRLYCLKGCEIVISNITFVCAIEAGNKFAINFGGSYLEVSYDSYDDAQAARNDLISAIRGA